MIPTFKIKSGYTFTSIKFNHYEKIAKSNIDKTVKFTVCLN